MRPVLRVAALATVGVLALSACSSAATTAPTAPAAAPTAPAAASTAPAAATPCKSGKPAPTIALIMPNNDDPQYEQQHVPAFKAAIAAISPDIKILNFNSEASVQMQQTQAESAITQGAQVISLVPNDIKAAATIANEAKAAGVKVIALGRLIQGAPVDALISYDPAYIGQIQGKALVAAMKERGLQDKMIVMLNGAPSDDLAVGFKKGAHDILDTSGIKIGAEYDDIDWTPATAQRQMEQAITKLGAENIGGVLAVTDGVAGAAAAAMKMAGMDLTKIPMTGQNSDPDGIQRLLIGEQTIDVYRSLVKDEGVNAKLSVALGCGDPLPADLINGTKNNGFMDVPAYLAQTIWPVTKDTIKSVIVADNPNFLDLTKICTPTYAAACAAAGLTP